MHLRTVTRAAFAVLLATSLSFVAVMPSATALPPRPGCGFGDMQHAHQAAPGLDPLGLRPGRGAGDQNHPHTAPPGQAPDGGGDQSNPRRGCPDSPLG